MVACFCVLNVAQWSFNDRKREEDTDHGSMCDYHFCLETFINIKSVRKTKKERRHFNDSNRNVFAKA